MPPQGSYFEGLPEAPAEGNENLQHTAGGMGSQSALGTQALPSTQEEINAQWQQYYEQALAMNDQEAIALYEQWRASYAQAYASGSQHLTQEQIGMQACALPTMFHAAST